MELSKINIEEAMYLDPYAFTDEMYSDKICGINTDQYESPKFIVNEICDSHQKMIKNKNQQIISKINKKKLFKIDKDIMNNLDLPIIARFTDVARPKRLLTSTFEVNIAKKEIIAQVKKLEKFFISNRSGYYQLDNHQENYFEWFNKVTNFIESFYPHFYYSYTPSNYIPLKKYVFSDAYFIVPNSDNINYYINNTLSKMEEYFKLVGVWPRVCIDASCQNKYMYYYYCFDYRTNVLAGFKVFSTSNEAGEDIIKYIYNMQHSYPHIDLSYFITVYNKQYYSDLDKLNKRNFKNSLKDILQTYKLKSVEEYENVFTYHTFSSIISTILDLLSWSFKYYNQPLHPLIIVNMGFEFRLCIMVDEKSIYWSFSSSEDLYKFIDALNSSEDLDKFVESLNYKKGGE